MNDPLPPSAVNPAGGPSPSLTMEPIGFVRTGKRVKFHALHQPEETRSEENILELIPNRRLEAGLRDLAGFSRIWLLWWFHRNTTWRPSVLPPRGPAKRRGVFATRSPHRPNPLGLTPVQLTAIRGRCLHLGPCDLVDGTPVFDIKPYIPAYDSFPDASAGWLDEVETGLRQPPAFAVHFAPLASTQVAWLRRTWSIDFTERLTELLSRDPSPHRSRRIRKRVTGVLEIGCGAWRATFEVLAGIVTVQTIEPAYPRRFLVDPARAGIADCDAQLAFLEQWPESAGP
ncbi:MAG: tRNA (N6-threonylcarbamoyladenosine(37)-N6)-methyltransferase TrmO [Opitutaceae bacterium]|nr:tRNA (N6-threonylcarbamoyladenosine(37)-N6)-methyltransferase TrmO [Opitutaceae bacterium]